MKIHTLIVKLIAIISLSISLQSFAQLNITVKHTGSNLPEEVLPPGVSAAYFADGNGAYTKRLYDPNKEVNVIVKFKEPALSELGIIKQKYVPGFYVSAQSRIENEHTSFRNALSQIESSSISMPNSVYKAANTKIKFEYKTVINGISLTTKQWVLEEIRRLPYVQAVFEDKEVKAIDDQSNHLIGADSVWQKLNITGKGIKIGIIDTGIDYTHSDLGGGIGQGYKVFGGYDFINNDNNPMDDHGHGTHVAGIAAANGTTLKGVAPDALLYAIKVLNQDGAGPTSVVIAGIERALDPDQNPSTNDAVNIINMSLGGGGNPDDILSQAVDNASAAGVICVVAAGNAGSSYQNIDSPGCARTALTVGATDNNDNIASFSSRGPSNKINAIKPDLVAPGVSISSAKLGGGYISYNGTSMATPHVAGCAALILQIHPDWTPEMVKSVLMESAKDIGLDVWTQGNGRVDVNKAVSQTTLIIPSSLSFGTDDIDQTLWTKIDTFTIHNLSQTSETYDISLNSSLIQGVNVTLNNSSLSLGSGQTGEVTVTLEVDNNVVPFFSSTPPAFDGKLLVQSTSQSYSVPFSFVKSPLLNIAFDDGVSEVIITEHDNVKMLKYGDPGNYLSILLPKSTYDIFVMYSDLRTMVFKENIVTENISNISVNRSDAKNKIVIPMEDELGNKLITDFRELYIANTSTRASIIYFTVQPEHDTLWVSDFSNKISLDWASVHYEDIKKVYRLNGGTFGLSKDMIVPATKDSYRHLQFKANVPPSVQGIEMVEQVCSWGVLGGADVSLQLTSHPVLTYPFMQDGYYMPAINDSNSIVYFKKTIPTLGHTSPYYRVNGFNSLDTYFLFEYYSPFFSTTASEIPLNLGPPHWAGTFWNSSNSIKFRSHDMNKLFFNQAQDYYANQSNSLKYELYSGSSIIKSGNLKDVLINLEDYSIPVDAAGEYKLKIFNLPGSQVNGTASNITMEANLDTKQFLKNPSAIRSLNIISGDKYVDQVDALQETRIEFQIIEYSPIQNVSLELRSVNDDNWKNIPLTKNGSLYSSIIPNTLKKGYTSLRITISSTYNNSLVYTVEPAFLYGINHPPAIESITNETAKEDSLYAAQIVANDIDGNTLTYGLDIKPSWLEIDSLTGIISGTPKAEDVGTTSITASVSDGNGGDDIQQFNIQVIHTNHSPSITAIKDSTAFEDSLYKSQAKAVDIDKDSLKYKLDIKPSWINIDSVKGIISGIPKAKDVGDTVIEVKVEDGFGGAASYKYNLHVYHTNHAPVISAITNAYAIEDSLYTAQIVANDIDGNTLTYGLDVKPSWLEIDSLTGIISGIPKAEDVGTTSITASVSDGSGGRTSRQFNIQVKHTNHPPSIAAIKDSIAFEDSLYKSQVLAIDIDKDLLKYKLDIKPSWINIDSLKGVISGIPKAKDIGDTVVAVKVEDGFGGTVSYKYNLHVYHTNHAPVISAIADTTAKEDSLYLMQIKAHDVDGDWITYSFEVNPSWLSIDSLTGIIRGIPKGRDVGKSMITVAAKDSTGKKGTRKFNLYVVHTNHSPQVFDLLSPKDLDTLKLHIPPQPVFFSWNAANDIDIQDTMKYWFQLKGQGVDTLISGIIDTLIQLNIMPLFATNSVYTWTVDVTDGYLWNSSNALFSFRTSVNITGLEDPSELPKNYLLSNNYPNPFNPATTISYSIPKAVFVNITVYDMLGRKIKELVNEEKLPGIYKINFDASNLSSGIYIYRINTGDYSNQKKMIFLK